MRVILIIIEEITRERKSMNTYRPRLTATGINIILKALDTISLDSLDALEKYEYHKIKSTLHAVEIKVEDKIDIRRDGIVRANESGQAMKLWQEFTSLLVGESYETIWSMPNSSLLEILKYASLDKAKSTLIEVSFPELYKELIRFTTYKIFNESYDDFTVTRTNLA